MNKILQIGLISTILATSGFASGITGSAIYKNGWTIQNEQTINSNGEVTMQGGNLVIDGGSLDNSGSVTMKGVGGFVIDESGSLTNSGTLDISEGLSLSGHKGTVSNKAGSKVVIPKPGSGASTASSFTLNAPTGSGDKFTIEYTGGQYVLADGDRITITDSAPGVYGNLKNITDVTGIKFDSDASNHTTITNTNESYLMTLARIGEDTKVNISDNDSKTLNLDSYKSTFIGPNATAEDPIPEQALTDATTINFGLEGTTPLTVTGDKKLTLKGDCSQYLSKITTAHDLTFENKPSNGGVDVGGTLEFTKGNVTSYEISGVVNANSLNVPEGVSVKFTGAVTTGWTK